MASAVSRIRPCEHSFSKGHQDTGSRPPQTQIRGTVLPTAVPAKTKECENERNIRHPFQKSRRCVQLLLQQAALRVDGSPETGNQGNPSGYGLRQTDEPSPAGRCRKRQDHGGAAVVTYRGRQRLPSLRDGPDRSAGCAASQQFRPEPGRLGSPGRPAHRQHQGQGTQRDRHWSAEWKHQHPHRYPCCHCTFW